MAERCCSERGSANPGTPVACGSCGTAGKPVESLTVKALLTPLGLSRYEHAAYRFCPDANCPVVYFAQGGIAFLTSDARKRVWQKEPAGNRTICYCFGENERDISSEIDRFGQSRAVERVRAHIEAHRCACEVHNPRGTCCLGDVVAAVERMQQMAASRP